MPKSCRASRARLWAFTRARRGRQVHLEPGDVLLLYTDGLTERRGESLDIGLGRLIAHSTELRATSLSQVLTELARYIASADHDDVSALAVRRDSS